MSSKAIIGGILTGVLAFFLGWLIFGFLLMDYYTSGMTQYSGLMKTEPVMWAIAVSNLAYGILMGYIFSLGNINTVKKGFVTGMIISFLFTLIMDLFFFAQFNLYSTSLILVDILANAVFGGILGAFLGWWMSRK